MKSSYSSGRFTYIGAAYLFLMEDNKLLLQRRCNTGFEDGNYGVPAGHLEGGETAREGCVREIKEEIGIDMTPENLEVVHVMHRKSPIDERIDFFMTVKSYTGKIENCELDKCDDLRWFPVDDLPVNVVDYVKVAFNHFQNGVRYSEFGWD